EVFGALRRANSELGVTVVVVTHDPLVSEQVDRTIGIRDGRTSSEALRRTELNEQGAEEIIAEEYTVLDRAGRLQLPRGRTAALERERRVRLALERDHIGLWPDHARRSAWTTGSGRAESGSGGVFYDDAERDSDRPRRRRAGRRHVRRAAA